MPKQAKLSTAKVKKICSQYSDEFLTPPAGHLRCSIRNVLVKWDKNVVFNQIFLSLKKPASPSWIAEEKQILM